MISYIITARPERPNLINCLTSLSLQNSNEKSETFVVPIYGPSWYTAINLVVDLTKGEWLCFPSDDSYYVPGFEYIMMGTAKKYDADLVFCDILYDPRLTGKYEVLNTQPKVSAIDKICFMIKRDWFIKLGKFPKVDDVYYTDGEFIELAMKNGIKAVKAAGVLAVHN